MLNAKAGMKVHIDTILRIRDTSFLPDLSSEVTDSDMIKDGNEVNDSMKDGNEVDGSMKDGDEVNGSMKDGFV
jgi:hypothetical protein